MSDGLRIPTRISWGGDTCKVNIAPFLMDALGIKKGQEVVGCWIWENGRLYFEMAKPGEKPAVFPVKRRSSVAS